MKRHVKFFAAVLLSFTILLMLSACGSSLQKPTGLEPTENEQPAIESDPGSEELQEPSEELTTDISEEKIDEQVEKPQPNKVVSEKPVYKTEEQPDTATKEKQPGKSETTPVDNEKKAPTVIVDKKQPATEQEKAPVVKAPVSTQEKPVKKPVEKPAEKPVQNEQPAEPAKSTIVYSIVISSSEVPLSPTTMEIKEGDTVLAALITITKKHKIQMDYRGGQGATAYIEGMGNVYEFDRGQGSGWMYRVNGIFPDRGAGVVPLQDGDRVEWLYTTNLGVDLNADLKPFRR